MCVCECVRVCVCTCVCVSVSVLIYVSMVAEPKAMNNSIALPTIKSENTYSNLALEDDYTDRTISSPTDV